MAAAPAPFEEIRPALPFVLRNAATPEKHQIETMPGGVALLDYDNDGKLDIFFANGAPQPSLIKDGPQWSNRLYRNLGDWKFEDVTEKAGLAGRGYAMGVAAADYDNDGFTDLLVTSLGFSTLYHNRGDGTFEDVTAKAGIPRTAWPVSAGWFDYDNDGKLDLFIVNYCKWDPASEPFCGDRKAGFRTYCHPKYYAGLPNTLLHNEGGGVFTDVSQSSGIARSVGKGMAVAFADTAGTGRLDILITNDTAPNFLFRNEGSGKFTETGYDAGIAINDDGKIVSSMGADFRDIDNDGLPDIFISALANETFPLFRNLGKRLFQDMTYRSRIGAATLPNSGWSAGIFDFNNDGWKDIFVANGDVQDNTEVYSNRSSKQQNQLFLNRGAGTFQAATFGAAALHRGAAFGDIDGDGRIDVVVTRLGDSPVLYRNMLPSGNHWLIVNLRGTRSNRDGIGARIRIMAGGKQQFNHATTAVGYLSSSSKAVHFGLGKATAIDELEVAWPSGAKTVQKNVRADQALTIVE